MFYPKSEQEEQLRSELLRLSLLLKKYDWSDYGSEWYCFRIRGKESPVQPHCPTCNQQLVPTITEGREPTKDGWRKVWDWEFSCASCGFHEFARTAWFVDRYTIPESPDGYRSSRYVQEEREILVSESSIVWVDHGAEKRQEIEQQREALMRQIEEMRRNG